MIKVDKERKVHLRTIVLDYIGSNSNYSLVELSDLIGFSVSFTLDFLNDLISEGELYYSNYLLTTDYKKLSTRAKSDNDESLNHFQNSENFEHEFENSKFRQGWF